ncbi:cytochrome P450 [Conidiobolus coronatus NRRL 28638]|uniref:Cytochrome P450 n=1 Tax=Conidiobolus coronatus (strain ATCC 28846 / CBS 209.66 / NRRL 28638) TaxID=796925 RepID=A0A137NV15_CONC2|nr:cytochrome P450 [Conidiobolus coronatus NRRL 28638]|eukprot:KXN66518.1 cytochrome P450 [Conidiobolus coronatus NRRL 28638]
MLYYFFFGLLAYIFYKLYIFARCPDELKHLPAAPLTAFFAFHANKKLDFAEKYKKYFAPYLNEHGVVRYLTHTGWAIYIGEAQMAKEIQMKNDIFEKPLLTASLSAIFVRFFGLSQVLAINGNEWKRHRKVINPIFNQTFSTELFGNCASDLIDEWVKMEGEEAVKNAKVKLYTLYAYIAKEIFGKQLYIMFSILEYLPFTRRPKLAQNLKEYHGYIEDLIKSKTQELREGKLSNKGDLISALIESNEKSQEYKLTMEEIRDNLNIFIIAGHDTTSNTLTSTLYYLARYPELQDKLRAQIINATGDKTQVKIPTIDQLRKIPLLDKVNKESMRIMVTVPVVQRIANSIYTLSNGLVVPKGTYIYLHLWGIHHNPSTFPCPDEFNPNRFDDISNKQSKLFQAFTLGNRTCLGSAFSLMEQRVTISMLLQKFEFSISNDNPDYYRLRITDSVIIHPKEVRLVIKSRF